MHQPLLKQTLALASIRQILNDQMTWLLPKDRFNKSGQYFWASFHAELGLEFARKFGGSKLELLFLRRRLSCAIQFI